jgi:hypothetical protein
MSHVLYYNIIDRHETNFVLKTVKAHTVRTVSKSNRKIVERSQMDNKVTSQTNNHLNVATAQCSGSGRI